MSYEHVSLALVALGCIMIVSLFFVAQWEQASDNRSHTVSPHDPGMAAH